MNQPAQFSLFPEALPVPTRASPCGLWRPDADGYLALPSPLPLFARHLPKGDARLDGSSRVGRELQRAALKQLSRLAAVGCLQYAHYERVDDGPWERLPRGTYRRHPMLASVASFAVYRTAATAKLCGLGSA